MRIVAGIYGGRRLFEPKNNDIRPTSDKIRGAVFNMLASRGAVEGAYVLDAFCGSGALGLEALSRGAAGCTFIDKSRESLDLARKNGDMLGVAAHYILKDFTKIGTRTASLSPASLVFLDPPYRMELVQVALKILVDGNWLADGARIVCETEKMFNGSFTEGFICFTSEFEKAYGETRIVLLRYKA